ncbi:MAG: diguanylate cyclase [Candidatus Aminicenantia bacterium]
MKNKDSDLRTKEQLEVKVKIEKMELLQRIGLEIVSIFDLAHLLTQVVNQTSDTLGYDRCAIFLLEGEYLVLKAVSRFPKKRLGMKIPIGEGVVGRCAKKKEMVNIGDISRCKFYVPSGLEGVQSEIAVPIVYGNRLLGVLTTESTKKNAYGEEDIRLLSILSSQVGVALRNRELTELRIREMELLHQVGLKIVSVFDLDELLLTIVNLTKESLGYDNCAIFLLKGKKLILRALTHFPKRVLGMEIRVGEGVVGRCAKKKEVVNIGDISKCEYYIPSGLRGVKSALAVPIIYGDRLLGVLTTESTTRNAYDEESIRLLRVLCSQVGVALRNVEMHNELERLAVTDSLTGLYNYRYFRTRLDQEISRAKRYSRDLSLILIDLDNFKMVNDLFGHLKGDEVLILVSRLILDNTRKVDNTSIMKEVEIDIAARYGGEEFMLILPETPLKGVISAAERLRKLIEKEVNQKIVMKDKQGQRLKVTGSLGVACLKKDEGSEELIRKVDQAMYEAKERGKNQVRWIE